MSNNIHFDFQRAASAYDVPPGDLDAVVNTARRRTARRHRLAAAAAAVALIATSVTAVQRARRDDDVQVRMAESIGRGDAGISWQRVDARSIIGDGAIAGEGPLYALSTAAGERDPTKARRNGVVWRSDDGVEWHAVGSTGDLYLSDVSKRDDRLYGIGTAPSTAKVTTGRRVNDVIVGWADGGGAAWQSARLPVDMAGIASKSKQVYVVLTDIAAGPKGTVAAVRVNAELDVPRLLPAGTTAPHGWAVTATGVDVLGRAREPACPSGTTDTPPGEREGRTRTAPGVPTPSRMWPTTCFRSDGSQLVVPPQEVHGVTSSFTFAQLGVAGDTLAAVKGEPLVFSADAGTTEFRRVAVPETGEQTGFRIEARDDGFLMTMATFPMHPGGESRVLLVASSDGRTWKTVNEARRAEAWPVAMGTLGGVNTLVAGGADGGVILRDSGSGGWTAQPAAALLDADVVGDDTAHILLADIGPFGGVVLVSLEPTIKDGRPGPEPRGPRFHILATRDGRTWQDHPVEDLAGTRVLNVPRVIVNDDNAVVTIALPRGGNGPRQLLSLVATSN